MSEPKTIQEAQREAEAVAGKQEEAEEMKLIDKIDKILDEQGDATRVIIGFTVAICIFVSFLYMADYVNKTAEETSIYCNAHPEVEMWESEQGTANCTAWREGKVVAI